MSAKSGGSFAALLMSGPLAAIPLMALFGVPQFASVSTSIHSEEDSVLRRPQHQLSESTEAHDIDAALPTSGHSEFPLLGRTSLSEPPTSSVPPSTPWPTLSGSPTAARPTYSFAHETPQSSSLLDGPDNRPISGSSIQDSTLPRTRPTLTTLVSSPGPDHATLTWENAARKLQELGIDDYRLEPGQNENSYVFICQFTPGSDERIIRRFEAEASEPADAVQKVVQRVIAWRQHDSTE